MKITNISEGPRGFHTAAGSVTLEKGQTWEGDLTDAERQAAQDTEYFAFGDAAAKKAAKAESEDPVGVARREVGEKAQTYIDNLKVEHADALSIANARADDAEAALAEAKAEIEELKADLAEATKPADKPDLPSLTGKNKAELLTIAKDEGAQVPDDATNAQIVEAIEAKRGR